METLASGAKGHSQGQGAVSVPLQTVPQCPDPDWGRTVCLVFSEDLGEALQVPDASFRPSWLICSSQPSSLERRPCAGSLGLSLGRNLDVSFPSSASIGVHNEDLSHEWPLC